jgi:hypothetical protein
MTDSVIPNSLSITIHTDIPGYQNINFKPSMIDPQIGDSNKTVWFNPLVKLDKNVIDKVPAKFRVSEFFRRDYFRSLINYHGMKKKKTLEEATEAGFVDNNISVMLNLLFPTKGIIYINKEPYSIGKFDWTKGDWKIDNEVIEVPQLNINRIRNPYTLSQVVNSKIKSGNIALSKLPSSVIQGPNYSGPPVLTPSTTTTPTAAATTAATTTSAPVASTKKSTTTQPPVAQTSNNAPVPSASRAPTVVPGPSASPVPAPAPSASTSLVPKPIPPPKPPKPSGSPTTAQSTAIVNAVSNAIKTSPPLPPPPKPLALMPPAPVSSAVSVVNAITRMSQQVLQTISYPSSRNSNQEIRTFFGIPGKSKQSELGFFDMVNELYTNLPLNVKSNIVQMLRNTTNVSVKNPTDTSTISQQAYAFNVENMNVFSSETNGNCFFDSLQQSINIYNKNIDLFGDPVDRKITYDIDGIYYGSGNNLFTQDCLREIVLQQVIAHKNRYIHFATPLIPDINRDFRQAIANYTHEQSVNVNDITLEIYNLLLENVYTQFDGYKFLIIYPVYDDANPLPATNTQQFMNPYTVANSNDDIRSFILSPVYWGDEIAIRCVQEELNLTPIILTKNTEDQIKIANPQDLININVGGKYTFLYHSNDSHYELISFGYHVVIPTKGVSKSPNSRMKTMTVFTLNSQYIPPLQVIFLLFASFYLLLNNNTRKNIQLLHTYLNGCYESFIEIYQDHQDNDNDATLFLRVFNNYFSPFPNSFNVEFPGISNLPSGGGSKIGGAYSNYPYNSPSYPRNPYTSNYSNSYRSPYGHYSPYNRSNSSMISSNSKDNDISYHIDIYMVLQKGKDITDSELKSLNCKLKQNNIERAFAILIGKKYVIKPNYDYYKQKKTHKNNSQNNNNPQNITKKNYNNYRSPSYGNQNYRGPSYGNQNYRGPSNGYSNGYNNGYNNHYTRKYRS